MAMKGSGGGGYGSRQVTERPVKTGSGSRSTRPAGVAMFGQMQGTHITHDKESSYRAEKLHGGGTLPTKFGNAVAASTQCGPGGSREVMGSGSQGTHGATTPGNPQPKARGILNNE